MQTSEELNTKSIKQILTELSNAEWITEIDEKFIKAFNQEILKINLRVVCGMVYIGKNGMPMTIQNYSKAILERL